MRDESEKTQGIKPMVYHFYGYQQKYYRNEINDEQLTDVTTQPFWQSMRLSKRRLAEKGLTMDISVKEKAQRSNHKDQPAVTAFTLLYHIITKGEHFADDLDYGRDGSNRVENFSGEVTTERTFYHKGKKIHRKKEHEFCSVNVLSTEVDGENASCPNCGNIGKISGFIDGCEYCGAKFTVQDFEPKISAFALEEDIRQRIQKTLLKTGLWLGIFTILMAIIAGLSMVFLIISAGMGDNVMGGIMSLLGFSESIHLLAASTSTIWALIIMLFALMGLAMSAPKQIKGKKVVSAVIEHFSFRDFFQNLEYKLRNIHLTDRANEVNAFASFDLSSIVAEYKEVVDCQMRSIKFLAARSTADGYELDLEANLKLSVFDGNRIRTKYESLKLTVFGKREILKKSTAAIREYKCPNCAGSIDLLEGSTCKYCGTWFDYANYGWKLLRYQKVRRVYTHTWISLLMIVLYILIFSYNYKNANIDNSDLWNTFGEIQEMGTAIEEFFDAVPTPDEVDQDAVLVNQTENYAYRKCVYSVTDCGDVARDYSDLLSRKGFSLYENDVQDFYYMYQEVEYQGEYAYLCIAIDGRGSKMLVEYSIKDSIE